MGLFGTKAAPRQGKLLRASGMRINVRSADTIRTLASARQDWQSDAWGYRDMIGELRFGLQFRSRAVSRVKYFAAQVMPEEDEPIPLDSDKGVKVPAAVIKIAQEEMARLPLSQGFGFLGVLDENFGVTGEAWLHGYMRDGEETWEVHSVDEVRPGADGRVSLRPYGTAAYRTIDPEAEEMLRLWIPHPRYKILADSPMKALLNTCEEIVLAGQEMRSASRSRTATNGILLIPDTLTLLNALKNDTALVDDDAFMAELTAILLAPISNEGDPGQVAPAVLRGDKEDLAAVRHLKLERETSADLIDRINAGLERLARGLDIPPEIISGLGDSNHWSAWQIDASTYRYHIDPAVRIIADSLTEGFLRPAMIARGVAPEIARLVQVWYDAGNITENPNRGQDAKDAYDRGAIGFAPLRQALGFNETDAPSDEEVLRMVALRIGIDPATSGQLLQVLFNPKQSPVEAIGKRVVDPAGPDAVPSDAPKQITAPGQTPPDSGAPTPPSAGAAALIKVLTASADPEEWSVDERSGRSLMDVDRALRDQIQHAADAALSRALEKAGARIKSKAQKNKALATVLTNADVWHAGEAAGRQAVLALGLNEQELLADAFAALEEKFTAWVNAAIENIIVIVLRMLRVKPGSKRADRLSTRLRTQMGDRVDLGWTALLTALNGLAERKLYNPAPDASDQQGEFAPGTLVPIGLVRGALAVVGGVAPGVVDANGVAEFDDRQVDGLGLGQDVTEVLADEGAQQLGYEWVYGVTPRNHFLPHLDLDGRRFVDWQDAALVPPAKFSWVGEFMRPGDHRGCACDVVPVYAIREFSQTQLDRLAEDTPSMRDVRLLAEEDDAAGRTRSTAQATRDQRDRILALRKQFLEQGVH